MDDFLWWAFVRCWPLGEKCEVNWDAWAALGACAAVVVALFGPAIRRLFVRKKTNALFALAYRGDVVRALAGLGDLNARFPLDPKGDAAWAVHSTLTNVGRLRSDFIAMCGRLDELSKREVDLTKWEAVNWNLAVKIAIAIETTVYFQTAAHLLAELGENPSWNGSMHKTHQAQVRAVEDISAAAVAIQKAIRGFSITNNQSRSTDMCPNHAATPISTRSTSST